MGWVYLDDAFPDNPKVRRAGEAAAYLYVTMLCYAKRWNTNGRVPEAAMVSLSPHRLRARNVRTLITVGLVKRVADEYVIHDWEEWNKAQTSRSEAGRKAAQARWSREKPHAKRNANASPSHMPHDALSLSLTPSNSHPLTTPTEARASGDEEEDEIQSGMSNDERIAAVTDALADADLAARRGNPSLPAVADEAAWRKTARHRRAEVDGATIAAVVASNPDMTIGQLVDAVVAKTTTPTGQPLDHRYDEQQRAMMRKAEDGMRQLAEVATIPPDPTRLTRLAEMRASLTHRPPPTNDGAA